MITFLFACRNFNNMAGGVERMSTLIMNEMVERGHKVVLLTWDPNNANSHYQLNPEIRWHKLNLGSSDVKANWLLRFKRQLTIRKIVKEIKTIIPNVVKIIATKKFEKK